MRVLERTLMPAPLTSESMHAAELRAALIEAAGPRGRMDRHGQPLGPK